MSLDPRFICSGDIESYFVDKLTALPLAGGTISFFSDASRTTPKAVYKLSGSPPYSLSSFVSLGDTVTLNSAGEYQDGLGNPIVIYYFPYMCTTDGDPTTSTGTQELYYITVANSGSQQQYTRVAWPPLATNLSPSVTASNGVKNYIPNGQFLYYNTSPPAATNVSGIDVLNIAQGGWSWQVTHGSTGVYAISFNSELNGHVGLNDFPFNSVNIACTSFGNETTHDLVIQWPDVNTFANLVQTPSVAQVNSFNLMFAASVTGAGSQPFQVYLISNFGTGGSATISTLLTTVNISNSTNAYGYYNVSISAANLPNNSAATVGAGNYIAIAIRTPGNAVTVRFTDFALTLGTTTFSSFPIMTEDEMLSRGVAGWMPTPNPDGSDLYLPLRLTPKGMEFDHTLVGKIMISPFATAAMGELSCDGSSYVKTAYSSDGIPFKRLFNAIFDTTMNIPIFGTGSSFINNYISSTVTANVMMCANATGNSTAAANGTASPGFTYAVNYTGASSFDYKAYMNTANVILAVCNTQGSGTAVGAGTSGMTVAELQNNASVRHYFNVTAASAAALSNAGGAGKYFTFGNTTTNFYMWFQITNETDPAPGGTGIQVNLNGSYSATDVAIIIMNVLNGFKVQSISCVSPPANSYFTFSAGGNNFYGWYKVDGVGTDPAVAGKTAIEIDVSAADTNAVVASKTRIALNSYQFAVPNLQGLSLRGYDPNSLWDRNPNTNRFSMVGTIASTGVDTIEIDTFSGHVHTATTSIPVVNGAAGAANIIVQGGGAQTATVTSASTVISIAGVQENRPVNFAVNYVIKY